MSQLVVPPTQTPPASLAGRRSCELSSAGWGGRRGSGASVAPPVTFHLAAAHCIPSSQAREGRWSTAAPALRHEQTLTTSMAADPRYDSLTAGGGAPATARETREASRYRPRWHNYEAEIGRFVVRSPLGDVGLPAGCDEVLRDGARYWTQAIEKLPRHDDPAPQDLAKTSRVDDHQTTGVGHGPTLAMVRAKVEMYNTNFIQTLPEAMREGLFGVPAGCAGQDTIVHAAILRFSHTNNDPNKAPAADRCRVALKIDLSGPQAEGLVPAEETGKSEEAECNLLFVESIPFLPSGNAGYLQTQLNVERATSTCGPKLGSFCGLFCVFPWNCCHSLRFLGSYKRAGEVAAKNCPKADIMNKTYYSINPQEVAGKFAVKFVLRGKGGNIVASMPPTSASSYSLEAGWWKLLDAIQGKNPRDAAAPAVTFELCVQIGYDPKLHPINDLSKEWKESNCPYYVCGRVTIPRQALIEEEAQGLTKANVLSADLRELGSGISSKTVFFDPVGGQLSPGRSATKKVYHQLLGEMGAFRSLLYKKYDIRRCTHVLGLNGHDKKLHDHWHGATTGAQDAFQMCPAVGAVRRTPLH